MKITYSGKPEALAPAEQKKIDARFEKLARLLDKRDNEREAHVIYSNERHIHNAEIRVNYRDHELFGAGSAADTFTALSDALEKLEKQILKVRAKWRDTARTRKQEPEGAPAAQAPARERTTPESKLVSLRPEGPSIFRIDNYDQRKPMTLDEAMLEIDDRDYVVYRDADSDRVNVLIRRRDGNYDLIEA